MLLNLPRLVIAGLAGDSGKTVVTLSILAHLRSLGVTVAPFKKGPDYIDAAWLSTITGIPCRNLDTYLVEPENVRSAFAANARGSDLAIIEGNRGIFDGKDLRGTHSTAGLAKLLQAPVVLVIDCTKTTLTVAALVKGCQVFDPDVNFAGVILNRVAGNRHADIVSGAVTEHCDLPILGVIPKLPERVIPGRHLGLITPSEYEHGQRLENCLRNIANKYVDIEKLLSIAESAPPLELIDSKPVETRKQKVKIGYFRDSIFTFYYPENLEALSLNGAGLLPISSIADAELPDIDSLYIGGGFPETQAERLSGNESLRHSVKLAAKRGLPIYAECGGLIYLARSLTHAGRRFPMSEVFPIDFRMHPKPVGHGYTYAVVDHDNPFFEIGDEIKGHEFHYSGPVANDEVDRLQTCFEMKTGVGLVRKHDGLVYKNVLACYTHIHALGAKDWASKMVAKALEYRASCDRENGAYAGQATGIEQGMK